MLSDFCREYDGCRFTIPEMSGFDTDILGISMVFIIAFYEFLEKLVRYLWCDFDS